MKKHLALIAGLSSMLILSGCIVRPPLETEESTASEEASTSTETVTETIVEPADEHIVEPAAETPAKPVVEPVAELPDEPAAAPSVVSFSMVAKQWAFEPATITVKEGDTVKLSITSTDVTHGFALPTFGVNASLAPNETTEVEFVADKKGTFTFFCSVFCGEGHTEMSGTLVVE
ncbi:MAG: cupredoxin domain-containing protein [Patescibacteria group bacterium]